MAPRCTYGSIPAWIIGRNMFGPLRGDWRDEAWKIDEAMMRAKKAAGSKDVRVGGGVETVRQYVRARRVDEIHVAIAPVAYRPHARCRKGGAPFD